MIEYLGFIYGVGKDLLQYLKWKEEVKLVDREWLTKSGLEAEAQKNGWTLRWVRPDKVETRRLDGYGILIQVDKEKRIRHRIERKDNSVLMPKLSS